MTRISAANYKLTDIFADFQILFEELRWFVVTSGRRRQYQVIVDVTDERVVREYRSVQQIFDFNLREKSFGTTFAVRTMER